MIQFNTYLHPDIIIPDNVMFREQRVKARRNNKEMLKHEIQFMSNYLEGSRVKTSQVAESKNQSVRKYKYVLVVVGCYY